MSETTTTVPASVPEVKKWQQDPANPAGKIQCGRFNDAWRALTSEHHHFIELTGVVGGAESRHCFYSPFGVGNRADVLEACAVVGAAFNWTVSRANVGQVIAAIEAALPALQAARPVKDERITAEQQALNLAARAQRQAEQEAEAQKQGQAERASEAQWAIEYPYLERAHGSSKSIHAVGAANIREELARKFPGHAFTVKSERGSIDIGWELGPTTEQVKAVTDKYQTEDFDGMQDMSISRHSHWPAVYGGARFVFENRSDGEWVNVVALGLCSLWGLTPPADGKTFWNIRREGEPHDVGSSARQIILKRAYPVGAVITGVEMVPDSLGGLVADFYRATYTVPEVAAASAGEAAADGGQVGTVATVSENREKGGIELRFPSKPAASVLENLKAHGWRWSRCGGCWYKSASEEARKFAARVAGVCGGQTADAQQDHSSYEDRECGDAAYEDQCAAACGA